MTGLGGSIEEELAALARRYGLDDLSRRHLVALLEGLSGDPRAPTTVRPPQAALEAHIADSLVALELAEVGRAARIADLGSGAGFPGLVLASALPNARVWLVESQARKCSFIASLAARAGLANARVVCARAEQWEAGEGQQDLVVSRALAPQPVVLEYAAPLLGEGGHLVEWRGARSAQEERQSAVAADLLGLALVEVRHVNPFAGARERHLHVFRKVAATPAGFPRRAGLARKRPLGG